MLLHDKGAVITGGAGGLGRAIAEAFLREGARVVLTDVSTAALDAAKDNLGDLGQVLTCAGDVSSSDDVAAAANLAVEQFGSLDIWVNNAGFTRDATMRKMSESDFDDVLRVHVKGTWLGTPGKLPASCASNRQAGRSSTCRRFRGRSAWSGRRTTAPRRPASWD